MTPSPRRCPGCGHAVANAGALLVCWFGDDPDVLARLPRARIAAVAGCTPGRVSQVIAACGLPRKPRVMTDLPEEARA